MTRYYSVLTDQHRARFTNRNIVLARKARYAHDKNNTTVTIQTINMLGAISPIAGGIDATALLSSADHLIDVYSAISHASRNENTFVNMPVSATVKFRFPLQIPFAAPLFSNVDDKPYARLITVTVSLS